MKNYLNGDADQRAEIKIKIGEEKITGEESKLNALAITEACIKLIEEKTLDEQSQQEILNDINTILGELIPIPEFQNDIRALQTKALKLTSYKGYEILDTDHPNDLLLLGTEVAGSCQRVDGSADLNKGLLAYLLDGKHRAIVIVSPSGEIVARSLLRLLLDEKTGQAILFQEVVYPKNTTTDLRKALQDMAIKRAEILNVPLVASESTQGKKDNYPNALISKGGPAPFEYVDAVAGNQPNCRYTIPASYPEIYTPTLGPSLTAH